jgi:hypothetical protein
MTITRESLTSLMGDRSTVCEKANALISPKKIAPHKGVRLDGVHGTPEGFWSAIIFPQWVVLADTNGDKSYRFRCTEDGEFIDWSTR